MIQVVILGTWLAVILFGSILALRGSRNWATVLQVAGSSCLLAGVVGLFLGAFFAASALAAELSSSSTSASSMAATGSTMMMGLAVGGLLTLLGAVLFTAGYLGMCAKYGATERRARQLEEMIEAFHHTPPSGG